MYMYMYYDDERVLSQDAKPHFMRMASLIVVIA